MLFLLPGMRKNAHGAREDEQSAAQIGRESELAENTWLTVGADPGVIFDTPVGQRWDKALGLLGLQAWMLSPEAGHS